MNDKEKALNEGFIVEFSEISVKTKYVQELLQRLEQDKYLCLIKYAFVRKDQKAISTLKNLPEMYEKLEEVYLSKKSEYDEAYGEVNEWEEKN